MSSENDFRLLRSSDAREKLDGFKLSNIESPQDMKNAVSLHEESDCKRLRPERKYNVRKSLAWDSAFLTSPGVLELDELFGTVNSQFMDNSVDVFGHEEEMMLHSGILEPTVKSRVDKCDLRKSLAWDNAFFTNAGVLDPEELSVINRGFKNSGTPLSGIQEDVSRSNESNFSMDSSCSSLTSLEIELFEDIKLSHKSTNKLSLTAPILKFHSVKGSDKLDTSSQTRLKGMPTSRKQNINPHGSERRTKNASLSAPLRKQLSAGNGEPNSSLSLKPPKSSNLIKNTPTVLAKRTPLRASLLNVGTAKSASGQCPTIPKKPSPGTLDSVFYCSTASPKLSTLGSPTAVHESVSSSLNSSGSSFKTPFRRHTIRKRAELGSSCPSSDVFIPRSSSCTSPDSSHDGWSSEASSTSTVKKSCNPKAYVNTSSRQISLESVATRESALHQSCPGIGGQGRRLLNHHNKKIPLRTDSLHSTMSKNTKPSDLRMPSPKIGYFDEENSSIATTDGSAQFHSGTQIAKSKIGSGTKILNHHVNQAKSGKPMMSRTISGTPKQHGPESAMQLTPKKPTDVDEVQNAFLSEPDSSATIKICFPMSFKVEKGSPQETTSKDCLQAEIVHGKGQDTAAEDIRCTTKAESEYGERSMEGKFSTKHMEIVIQRASKRTLDGYEAHINHPGKNLSILDDNDKENMYCFEEQVDGLSKCVRTIDLGDDMMIELKVTRLPGMVNLPSLTLKI